MPVEAPPAKATKVPQKKKKKNGLIVNYFAKEDRPPTPSPRKKRAPSPPHEPVPEDNFDIAVRICRVRRVESRRDRDPAGHNDRIETWLTYFRAAVSRNVPIAIQRCLPVQMSAFRSPGPRARRHRRLALVRSREPPLRSPWAGQQPQETCRVSLPYSGAITIHWSHSYAVLKTRVAMLMRHRKGQYGRALEEAIQTQKHQWPSSWNHINPLHGGRSFNTMPPNERVSYYALYRLNSC